MHRMESGGWPCQCGMPCGEEGGEWTHSTHGCCGLDHFPLGKGEVCHEFCCVLQDQLVLYGVRRKTQGEGRGYGERRNGGNERKEKDREEEMWRKNGSTLHYNNSEEVKGGRGQ